MKYKVDVYPSEYLEGKYYGRVWEIGTGYRKVVHSTAQPYRRAYVAKKMAKQWIEQNTKQGGSNNE